MKTNAVRPEREYYRSFYRGNKLNFTLSLILTVISSSFMVILSRMLGGVTDCMTTRDWDGLVRITWMAAVMLPVFALLWYLQNRVNARFINKALLQYKSHAFSRLSEKSISAFSREHTGRYLSALTNDVNSIERQYLENIFNLVSDCLSFLLALGTMLYFSPALTLSLVIVCIFPVVVSLTLSKKYAAYEKQVSDQNEKFTAGIKDLLNGFAVIKSFKAEAETRTLFDASNSLLEQEKKNKRDYAAIMNALGTMAGLLAQMGTFIVGAFMALGGSITPGVVMTFVNLSNDVIRPIETVPTRWAEVKAARALIQKLAALNQENASRSGETIPPALEDAITMEHLTFGYEEGKPILKDINLTIEAGKKYAIVGASGSGKSTLLNLLMGADDRYDGSIAIDGRELHTIDPDSLYDLMSLIGQNVFLFDNTIRENITMFRTFPDAAVDSAALRSGLAGVIAAKGEDYRCGENGCGLSGGERQRVSIARSLLRGTPVLMLDEATAALDNQTAFEVTDAILHLDGLTRIVVTHRLEEALLKQYDEIIVLREGRIAERGTYDALMARTGYFYSLYNVSNP